MSPLNYTAWLMILNAVIFSILLTIMNKPGVVKGVFREGKKIFFIGGTLSYTVYGTIVWAFTQAPVPLVAALRETSIIFALLIGTFFLKEKFTLLKTVAVLTIFFGVILLKFI
jgi:drug/metabolite transporter (DMT)-like permease